MEQLANGISKLIADSYGTKAADAYLGFMPNEAAVDELAKTGRELLSVFPPRPGACVLMSALYAVGLRADSTVPAYVVAGSLLVGQDRVFGDGNRVDGATVFSKTDLSWNGLSAIGSQMYRYFERPIRQGALLRWPRT